MQRDKKYDDEKLNKAVEELKSYRVLKIEAEDAKKKAEEYRERYSYGLRASTYDGERVACKTVYDKMVSAVVAWADLDALADEKERQAEERLWSIRHKLEVLVADDRLILDLYFLKGYNNDGVSRIMCHSVDWVKWAKRKALKKYSEL